MDYGNLRGRHYSTYVDEVKELCRNKNIDAAEKLLLELVRATEKESVAENTVVAPWYYEKLAILYRSRKDYNAELNILERFTNQKHTGGVKPAILIDRLEKLKIKLLK